MVLIYVIPCTKPQASIRVDFLNLRFEIETIFYTTYYEVEVKIQLYVTPSIRYTWRVYLDLDYFYKLIFPNIVLCVFRLETSI